MIYITGDTHREFSRLNYIKNIKENDMLIVLGDAGINYCLDNEDISSYELQEIIEDIDKKRIFSSFSNTRIRKRRNI